MAILTHIRVSDDISQEVDKHNKGRKCQRAGTRWKDKMGVTPRYPRTHEHHNQQLPITTVQDSRNDRNIQDRREVK